MVRFLGPFGPDFLRFLSYEQDKDVALHCLHGVSPLHFIFLMEQGSQAKPILISKLQEVERVK